jgi:hypothetical protein
MNIMAVVTPKDDFIDDPFDENGMISDTARTKEEKTHGDKL